MYKYAATAKDAKDINDLNNESIMPYCGSEIP